MTLRLITDQTDKERSERIVRLEGTTHGEVNKGAIQPAPSTHSLNATHTYWPSGGNRAMGDMAISEASSPVVQQKRGIDDGAFASPAPVLNSAESEAHYDRSLVSGQGLLGQLANLGQGPRSGTKRTTEQELKRAGYKHRTEVSVGGDVKMASERVRGRAIPPNLVAKDTAPYRNTFEQEGGIFGADWNKGPEDQDYRKYFRRDRVSSSEILFTQYKLAAAAAGFTVAGNLKEIHRKVIINPRTQHTVFWCNDGGKADNFFAAEGDDLAALLGTPNGNSAIHLLLDHAVELGITGIRRVSYRPGNLDSEIRIVFELAADAPN